MKLILCVVLAVMWGAAGAEVNKCVDQEGHVLFTDVPCPQGDEKQDAVAQPPTSSSSPSMVVAMPAPRSRWADLPHGLKRKQASVDASTLQTAYQSMLAQDELRKPRRLLSAR
ncbi:protein of unknown function [Duganella sp. CF402]|uniref:DUF4124 domain-containing protein n=1 Tax=unclassified Duganella TaxID=2636909 RepID=UPI0008C6736A|nr:MULTISPECIES: DUF4124 domain-containing protein [unclassified Duganella]RZT10384.1 uncharacterized protein DUF4124 [Duganella sp. BK701]SEL15396.1 protein of unknown function [Duganella sp. CF402]